MKCNMSVSLDTELVQALAEEKARTGKSPSTVINDALREHLKPELKDRLRVRQR